MRGETRCAARNTDHTPDDPEPDSASAQRPDGIGALVFGETILRSDAAAGSERSW